MLYDSALSDNMKDERVFCKPFGECILLPPKRTSSGKLRKDKHCIDPIFCTV